MRRLLLALLACLLVGSACSSEPLDERLGGGPSQQAGDSTEAVGEAEEEPEPLPPLDLPVRHGPFQLTIDRAPASIDVGATLEAADLDGRRLAVATVAEDRSAILRELPAGDLRVYLLDGDERVAETAPVTVLGGGPPDPTHHAGYAHDATVLTEGVNYIPTRDGTTLSAFVSLPGPVDGGPYPTLVEYSGYSPSRPGGDDPGRLLTTSLGYALVQVNVRGTGCSGGSFDAFELVQGIDGYDVVETVATQPWAGKVGMYGVSYAGIMQLQVAATRPPSLSAIAPLSVLDEVSSVLFPGGVYNNGFGEAWTRQVSEGAQAFGQGWEQARVDAGDAECASNQGLRHHNPDLVAAIRADPFASELTDRRSPITNAADISVPVFLAGAWQDEQTGGRWPALIDELSAAPTLRVLLYNGLHVDSIGPEVLAATVEFYDLHLDDPRPGADTLTAFGVSAGLSALFGAVMVVPFEGFDPADRRALRIRYGEERPIRVLFEMGAQRANLPVASFRAEFETWPPAEVEPETLFLDAGPGALGLGPTRPDTVGSAAFTTAPGEGAITTADDGERIWTNDPGWDWPAAAEANRVVATTEPLEADLVAVGPAAATLWVSADADDAEIEVTLSEIAPDGSETYVQSGWLRLSRRALDESASSPLRPVITGTETDVEPLDPGGSPVEAAVEIPSFAHVFRAGSRLRLTVDTPGASRPQWRFEVTPSPVEVTVHTGPATPSALTLPVIPGLEAPTGRPACGTLRGQPCRPAG